VDDTDGKVPVPDIPAAATQDNAAAATQENALDDRQWDSDASALRAEWDACYRRLMPGVVRYLMKCFGDSDMRDAADAAHSAFTELFAKWDTVRDPRPWLWTVAFRQMLRQNARPGYPLDMLRQEPTAAPASEQLELREETRAVLARLLQLPLAQRQVLALVLDEFSYSEIAQITGMTQDAVRKNVERARRKMKRPPGCFGGDVGS
jgi:RNA polymerase sigma factor (sigma-70 family)